MNTIGSLGQTSPGFRCRRTQSICMFPRKTLVRREKPWAQLEGLQEGRGLESEKALQRYLRIIANHQAVRLMCSDFLNHHRVFSYQAVFQPIDTFYGCILQKYAMLQNRRVDPAPVTNRRKRTNERVFDENVFANDDGPTNSTSHDSTTLSQLYSTRDITLRVHLSFDGPLNPIVENNSVGGQKIIFFPCI